MVTSMSTQREKLDETLSDLKTLVLEKVVDSYETATEAAKSFGLRGPEHSAAIKNLTKWQDLKQNIDFLISHKDGSYPSSPHNPDEMVPSFLYRSNKKSAPLSDDQLKSQIIKLSNQYKSLLFSTCDVSHTEIVDKQLSIKEKLKSGAQASDEAPDIETNNTKSLK